MRRRSFGSSMKRACYRKGVREFVHYLERSRIESNNELIQKRLEELDSKKNENDNEVIPNDENIKWDLSCWIAFIFAISFWIGIIGLIIYIIGLINA
ncbi:hypothetical protein [Clostridium thermobutyricum]|uniref:hypothetical protein n=1 Tax=Clostridium thermobutyricum TaxID=29372 RepID=UPI0018AC45E9|nr:hypothetical protein [Clostridium thermobutyricum]